ncbi:hypothetical protein EDC04DRAFT_2601505 [Pisolithus marmoratus]|nr:hypothetical protein EDC04DRAFT_2601505 [Pisolithus marmoratus]
MAGWHGGGVVSGDGRVHTAHRVCTWEVKGRARTGMIIGSMDYNIAGGEEEWGEVGRDTTFFVIYLGATLDASSNCLDQEDPALSHTPVIVCPTSDIPGKHNMQNVCTMHCVYPAITAHHHPTFDLPAITTNHLTTTDLPAITTSHLITTDLPDYWEGSMEYGGIWGLNQPQRLDCLVAFPT